MPAGRRGARAVAVQALYESDVAGHPAGVVVDRLAADMPDENAVFARELTAYVQREKAALDRMVDGQAKRFPAARMAAVDLNVLRVALAEVALHPETPQAVVINEAVELARLFGGEGSPGFVHGMLGALLR
jgi:N utilization substance protein B